MPIILTSNWDSRAVLTIAESMPVDKKEKWEIQAGKMFFKYRRATYHLRYINQCYQKMMSEMPLTAGGKQFEESDNSSYAGPLAEVLLFHLDGFFEAERSAHNFVLSCLSTADILEGAPNSLHDFYKKASQKPDVYLTNPSEVKESLLTFWKKTGLRTKEYRDCFNHSVSLSGPTWQHAVNMQWENRSWKVSFHLPDNPTSNSYRLFMFDKKLDALKVATEINEETDRFLRLLMATCSTKWNAEVGDSPQEQFTLNNVVIGG